MNRVNLRFISKGARAVEPFSANDEQPPVETTTYAHPSNKNRIYADKTSLRAINAITQGELRKVDLGPGLLTEIQVQEEEEEES